MSHKMSNTNLNFFLVFWILFTFLNLYIYHVKPHEENKTISELVRQNEPLYINLLTKLKDEQCKETTDNEKNTFYVCADGTKVSMIKWTRGSDRKGVVTREYNPAGKLLLVYGHPDDVY